MIGTSPDGPTPSLDALDADQCLELMAHAARERARWDAVMIRVQARFARLRPADRPGRGFGEFAADEVAAELHLSPVLAAIQLHLADTLTTRLAATVRALDAGEIDLERARAVAETAMSLPDEQAGEVERRVLAGGCRTSHTRFRQALRRAVLSVDAEGARRRHDHHRHNRQVRIQPMEDGMAQFWALLPAEAAQAAYQRVDALARQTVVPDDPRGMDERRADALIDLLLGRRRSHVDVEIQVTVPLATLAGLADHPGELAGYGPIPADLARELAENATWRRILTDPVDGTVLDVGRRRVPSPALTRHVRVRDSTCRFPTCSKPADRCDLDHTRPYVDGGTTDHTNLGVLCRRHHRLKHEAGWTLRQTAPGHFTWISPEKRTYHVSPEERSGAPASADRGHPAYGSPTRIRAEPATIPDPRGNGPRGNSPPY